MKVGSSKSSTNDFIRVSPNSSVTDVIKSLGSFVMFVLPDKIEERCHGEGSESANTSRPNQRVDEAELYCILLGGDIKLYA